FSGLTRAAVDFVEGRLRGRASENPARVEEEAERLRGASLPVLDELRGADSPLEGARRLVETMLRHAYGLEAPPVGTQPPDERRRALGRRLERPDEVSRDRYLFYTACTRATNRLYLVREAASDEGSPREASPFWDEVVSLFPADDVTRWTRRRALSALTWPLESAPSERERLRAVA